MPFRKEGARGAAPGHRHDARRLRIHGQGDKEGVEVIRPHGLGRALRLRSRAHWLRSVQRPAEGGLQMRGHGAVHDKEGLRRKDQDGQARCKDAGPCSFHNGFVPCGAHTRRQGHRHQGVHEDEERKERRPQEGQAASAVVPSAYGQDVPRRRKPLDRQALEMAREPQLRRCVPGLLVQVVHAGHKGPRAQDR